MVLASQRSKNLLTIKIVGMQKLVTVVRNVKTETITI